MNQKEIGKRDNYDNRHLSMVSSIISKESNNSNEDEIEKELERQLEKLKMSGSSINLSKVESQGGNGSNAGTDYATPDTTMIIPKFNIQDVDDDPEPQLENVQNELELEEETTRPLTITRTNSTYEDEVAPAQVEEPIAKSVKFTELQPEAKSHLMFHNLSLVIQSMIHLELMMMIMIMGMMNMLNHYHLKII